MMRLELRSYTILAFTQMFLSIANFPTASDFTRLALVTSVTAIHVYHMLLLCFNTCSAFIANMQGITMRRTRRVVRWWLAVRGWLERLQEKMYG